MFYYIAEANEHLCVTGFMIPDVYICKKTILYPGQRLRRIQMNPINYTLDVAAMTVEKLEFLLPCTFNVGIKDDAESILKYAKLLGHTTSSALTELVAGIIHGETRLIAAQMHVEEIFSNRQKFKENIMEHIGSELEHFGLMIYNSNIKDLRDVEGSEYFSYLSMKSREGAINQVLLQ